MKFFVPLLILFMIAPCATLSKQSPPGTRVNDLKREAIKKVDDLRDLTQQMVDQMYSYSELGFQEFETARYLTDILGKNGFTIERGVAGIPTAWVATCGSGKPVVAFISDVDCVPQASQKPGVAYHDPIVEGAPGHGEGHNSGLAVNVTAAIVLKQLMEKYKLAGTIKLLPGVAEELVGAKAFYLRAGLFKDSDIAILLHIADIIEDDAGPATVSPPPTDKPSPSAAWFLFSMLSTAKRRMRRARRGQGVAHSTRWS